MNTTTILNNIKLTMREVNKQMPIQILKNHGTGTLTSES